MTATVHEFPLAHPRADVIGVGASCVDYVCRLPTFPQAGSSLSKLRIRSRVVGCGGQTATTLATCASLGLRAKYVGVVGRDDEGKEIRRALQAAGVDVADVTVLDHPTASAVILLDDAGDRIVLWYRDGALALPPEVLPLPAFATARLVHVDDVDEPAALAAAWLARDAGIPVTCDIDRVTPGTTDLLDLVSLPILAEHVPQELTGERSPERALRALRLRHPGVLVVTLGEAGSMALDGETLYRAPAFDVDVVDSTGAGDVFRGGYIHGYLQGLSVPDTLRFANAAAAASCTRLGAMGGVPSKDDVRRVLDHARLRGI